MGVKADSSRKDRLKEQGSSRGVDALLRELVARVTHIARASTPPLADGHDRSAFEGILFDREIDGVRCTLARSHKPSVDTLNLSPREREVARMIAKGYPNKIIASVLEISVWTVSTHLRRIFAKLGVTSRAAMVTKMFRDGSM